MKIFISHEIVILDSEPDALLKWLFNWPTFSRWNMSHIKSNSAHMFPWNVKDQKMFLLETCPQAKIILLWLVCLRVRYKTLYPYKPAPMPSFLGTLMSRIQNLSFCSRASEAEKKNGHNSTIFGAKKWEVILNKKNLCHFCCPMKFWKTWFLVNW